MASRTRNRRTQARKLLRRSLVTLSVLFSPAPFVFAQRGGVPCPPDSVHAQCQCGRWTCPSCQQQMICPPTVLPGSPSLPPIYNGGTGGQSGLPPIVNQPGQPESGVPSPSDRVPGATAPTDPINGQPTPDPPAAPQNPLVPDLNPSADISDFLANNSRQPAFNASSDIAAPELMGDFFGPGGVPSIISETFDFTTSDFQDFGGVIELDIGGDSPPNDFFSVGPVVTDGSGARTVTLARGGGADDLATLGDSGLVFQGGTATQASASGPWVGSYSFGKPVTLPAGGLAVGRLKLAENYSPLPRDRVFFNYSLFKRVPLNERGITINRFSPGFEKTFMKGMSSFEFRAPFASTLTSDVLFSGGTDTRNLEFGNLFFALKTILLQTPNWTFTGGLSVIVPTADDTRLLRADGSEKLVVQNEAVHVMPYLGFAYTRPGSRRFWQQTIQIDADSNGDPILFSRSPGSALQQIGTRQDMTYLFLDGGFGFWLRRNTSSSAIVRGVAPIFEYHYNRSLNEVDSIRDGATIIQNTIQEIDNLNLLAGLVFDLRRRSRLSFGYTVPVGNGSDRAFDSELRVTFNKYF